MNVLRNAVHPALEDKPDKVYERLSRFDRGHVKEKTKKPEQGPRLVKGK